MTQHNSTYNVTAGVTINVTVKDEPLWSHSAFFGLRLHAVGSRYDGESATCRSAVNVPVCSRGSSEERGRGRRT
eukprot:1368839-Pleurochrysis_carterae.AAC.12